jgi:hypothetical protein
MPVNGSILWSTGETTSSITVAPMATTTYTATVSDNGFACADQVTIAIPPALPLSLPDETIVACNQTSTLLDAGSGGSSYLWSTGATSQTITVNAPGTYSVTVSNGCAKTDQTNVIMPHADIVQANQDICTGGNLTLSLATPVHGSILWSTGETTTSISVTTAGAYSVTVSDQGQSCTDAVTIGVVSPPVVSLPADSSPSCGTASVVLSPGAGAASYLWSNGATTPTLTVSTPGTYSVTASNGACSNTASTYVALPRADINGAATQNVCAGQSLTLSLTAPINGTILWSTGETTTSINVTTAGTYSVTVSDAGHSCSDQVDVVVDPIPGVTLAPFAALCANAGSLTLAGGLPGGGTYSGPGVSGGSFNPAAAGVGSHTIIYSYSSGAGCPGSATQSIMVNPPPSVSLAAFAPLCREAAPFALTGGLPGGGTYSGTGVSGGSFSPATAGVGSFEILYSYTDGNGCTSTDTRQLTVLPRPTLAVSDSLICAGHATMLTVNNAGPGASYAWSTGASGSSINPSPGSQTTYSVTVTNAAGCSYPLSQIIRISPSSVAPLAVSQMLPVDNSAGLDTPINFTWSPGANSTATSFDLYIWPGSSSQPGVPTVAGITALQYSYSGSLSYGQAYQWRIVARNACAQTAGPIQTFELRQLPDLRPSFVQAADTAYAGQSVEVSWNMSNTGPASTLAQQWNDAVYFSQDSVFSNTARYMGVAGNVTYLQPNGTYISTATFAVPLSMAGRYYVFVRADENGQLRETDETNNVRRAAQRCLVIVPTTPDLRVENVSHFSSIIGGDTLAVAYRVRNIGSVPLSDTWVDAGYISPDTTQNIAQNTGQGLLGPTARRQVASSQTRSLLPNDAYQTGMRLPIPHTFFGKYYVYTMSDDNNAVFETNSTNNVNPRLPVHHAADPSTTPPTPAFDNFEYVPITVTLRPPPDLVVQSVATPAPATAGTVLNVSWVGRNQGLNKPYPRLETFWGDDVWICPDATFNAATAISLGRVFHYNGQNLDYQAPNNTYSVSVPLALPNGISGSYYVYVATDAANNVFEHVYESNNLSRSAGTVAINLAYADLHPTAVSAPATVAAHTSFTVSYTIQNTSTAVIPAGGVWTDQISVTDAAGQSAIIASVSHGGPLAITGSYSNSVLVSLPNHLRPGTMTVHISTNVGGSVYEYTHTGNNSRSTTLSYLYSDDLAVQNLASTPAAYSGQPLTISWRVLNQGAYRTLASAWRDEVYLSADGSIDGSDLLLTAPGSLGGQLNPGTHYDQSQTVTLPQGISGAYFLLLRTANAPNGTLADVDLSNNAATLALPVTLTTPADLRIVTAGGQAPTFPASALAGQQVMLTYRVENFGAGTTPYHSWNDGIYLNTSPTVFGATRIGVFNHTGTLAAGAGYDVALNVTVPGYLAGNYYLFIVTDNNDASGYGPQFSHWGGAVQVGQVYEHQQEFNNSYQNPATINVTVPLPSDLVVTAVAVPGSAKLGKKMAVQYSIRNQGANPAVGLLKDGLYLSTDRDLSPATDRLHATGTRNLSIAAGQTITGVLRERLQAINPGSYHGILSTNLFQDVFESNYANDTLSQPAPTSVTVNLLPLNTLVPFALDRDSLEFYKVTPGAGVDLRLALGSNQNFGQNEVYVAYNRVPTASDFDYVYEDPINTRQELLIPTTGAGDYYVMVKTPYIYAGAQTATLFAEALPFQVRSISKDTVGQGRVTTRVLGAGFVRTAGATVGTKFYLTSGSDPRPVAYADIVRYRSSVEVTLRWHLDRDSVAVGDYNVVAEQANGTKVQLTNGLHVVPNSGLQVNFASITPPVLRVQTAGNWTYFLTNSSNVDVPFWEFQFAVPVGSSPVATHTPNVRKKSDFAPAVSGAGSASNGFVSNGTEVIPFVARDLRPGEIIQVNLRMVPPITFPQLGVSGRVHFPVVLNQQPAVGERFTRRTLDFIREYKAKVLANPGQFASDVVALAGNPNPAAWQDSLVRHYYRQGLLDSAWVNNSARASYTHLNSQTHVPGGVADDYWHIEEGYHNFRPDPFTAGYPVALRPMADSVFFMFNSRGATSTAIVASVDPNLITGPNGYGPRQMVGVQQRLNYKIEFENDSLFATGPAQSVRVEQPLSAAAELRNFRLGDFGFGAFRFTVPSGASTYSQLLNLPDSLGYDLRVVAGVDVISRQAFWEFQTIDPNTGQPPVNPLIGFLAVSDTLGNGQGYVSYSITPSKDAFTGDSLNARARIVFDQNTPVLTNEWYNIVDAVAPGSHLNGLPATQLSTTVHLSWTAADDAGGSGLRSYEVFAAEDNGPFVRVATDISTLSYDFVGQPGSRYDFFTLASDNTDNREAMKLAGEAFTVIEDTALVVYNLVQNQCLLSDPIVSTGSGLWQRLKLNGRTVAAINDQGHALGTVQVEFAVMSGAPVRADGRGTRYLDRNWHIIAQNPISQGQSVQLRFYALPAEYSKLQAADPGNVTSYFNLRLTQYSGVNEDCVLGNNTSATAQVSLLTPQVTQHADPDYFVLQATVADHFSEFYVNGGGRPLPVELTRFTAVRKGRDVQTTWSTASEKNSDRFEVERSPDGRTFERITTVAAQGNSNSPTAYAYLDYSLIHPFTHSLYYRLRQVDLDGSSSYSPVVAVSLEHDEAPLTLRAAPNPFHHGELQATIVAPAAGKGQLQLSDLAGRGLLSRYLELPAGTTVLALPELASLPPGVYVLTLRVGNELRQQKLLKE